MDIMIKVASAVKPPSEMPPPKWQNSRVEKKLGGISAGDLTAEDDTRTFGLSIYH